ncbi:MAG: hypothetical protein HUU54_17695 [Ignavibacteriaceae bacterium]|nr:hypothetical protein [Ignavibacteriaceae bacterium]
MKKIVILILTLTLYTTATIRYVKAGNPTPLAPYTSWATAADSIWKALRISVSGDTVFVGNGIYTETDTLPAGVSIIGSGIDSCIWSLALTNAAQFLPALVIYNHTSVEGIHFRGTSINTGFCIESWNTDNSMIKDCKFSKCYWGPNVEAADFHNNIFEDVDVGIISISVIPSGASYITNNQFINCVTSVNIAPAPYKTYVRNNYFYVDITPSPTFIKDGVGGQPEITNNIFILAKANAQIDKFIFARFGDLIQNNVFITFSNEHKPFIITEYPIISKNNHFEGKLNAHHLFFQAIGPQLVIRNNDKK